MSIDVAVGALKKTNKDLNGLNGTMGKLVGQSDETAQVVSKALSTVTLAVSAMEIGLGVQKMIDLATKDREVVKAAALTAANSINPAGWAKIALATAASVAVGAGIAVWANSNHTNPAIEHKIKADLSSASQRTAVSQLVGVMA